MSNHSKRFNLGCIISIFHLEKSPTRSSLFDQKLLTRSPFLSFLVKMLGRYNMITTTTLLVSLKTALKVINGNTKIQTNREYIAFHSTSNQRKAIEKLTSLAGIELSPLKPNMFALLRAGIVTIWVTFSKRRRLKYFAETHISLLTETVRFIYFFNYARILLRNNNKKFAILANDHSPEPLAFTSVCTHLNFKITYLQHGHVSEYFPPLFRYNLSILYGESSRSIYLKKGHPSKEIYFSGHSYSLAKPLNYPGNSFKVAIFPNVVNERKLMHLIWKLNRNPNIHHIYIKPHPAHDLSEKIKTKIKSITKATVMKGTDQYEEKVEVGIASNSSIHIELLSMGIPSIYYDDLDDIEFDYYGFVKAGAVLATNEIQNISAKEISDFYGADSWRRRVTSFDAAFMQEKELKFQHKKIKDYFSK